MACNPDHVYLTHYSKVADLERLARDMHQAVDDYVEIAVANEAAADRERAIQDSMFDYMCGRLEKHGFTGDREEMWSVMSIDVRLNSQGLSVWLNRRRKAQKKAGAAHG